jgi:hypothetical protein
MASWTKDSIGTETPEFNDALGETETRLLENEAKSVDQIFMINEAVNFPIDPDPDSKIYWTSLVGWIEGYGVVRKGSDEPGNEQPEFIGLSLSDVSSPRALHFPPNPIHIHPREVKFLENYVLLKIADLGDGRHRAVIQVQASDVTSSDWIAVLKSVVNDVDRYEKAATVLLPAGQASVDTLLTAITNLATGLISTETVGGDVRIVDSGDLLWKRPKNMTSWSCFKLYLHQPGTGAGSGEAYLTMWRFRLSDRPAKEEIAMLDSGLKPAGMATARPEYAAAIRVIQGDDSATAAANYGVSAEALQASVNDLQQPDEEFASRCLQSGMLFELARLAGRTLNAPGISNGATGSGTFGPTKVAPALQDGGAPIAQKGPTKAGRGA